MTSAGRDTLNFIAEICGAEAARQVGKACGGKRINMRVTALLRDAHPFRAVLAPSTMAVLIERLRADDRCRRVVRLPEAGPSEHLRRRRRRAALISKLTREGCTVRETALAAKVHSRTVTNHRARMRAVDGLTASSAGACP